SGFDKYAKLNNDIVLESINLSNINRNIDMNGFSFIIPSNAIVNVKATKDNQISCFYTQSSNPIFIVQGILELYAGELSSSKDGSLIKIENNGKIYTRNPIINNSFYDNTNGIDIGRPSIYDNQLVKLHIPIGTAIEGGKEDAYYHLDINAKTVIESQVQPTFYYSIIKSNQSVTVKQGIYNDATYLKNIPIFKHQLVMAIDETVTSENIENYLPKEIVTKDNQYITVHFDTSTFDESLEEQTLFGEYHNINDLFLPYLPKLELKILKNEKVPLSQFYTTFAGASSLVDVGMLSPDYVDSPIIIHINYTNAKKIFLQYSSNADFINPIEKEINMFGLNYPTNYNSVSVSTQEVVYFRLRIVDGLQDGYSNTMKIDCCQTYYFAEPDSQWAEQEIEDNETVVVPPPTTDNDKTETPNPLPDNGSDHRNDGSIDEPKDKSEVVIKKEEIESNIKAETDIIVDLKKHQVTIPYETAKKHNDSDIIVTEKNDSVEITSDQISINDKTIQIETQSNNYTSFAYIGYISVIGGVLLSCLCFFKYQRR
ncbi:MAG: hypothetical protein RR585_15295, partial [Coprobacillus sp.]